MENNNKEMLNVFNRRIELSTSSIWSDNGQEETEAVRLTEGEYDTYLELCDTLDEEPKYTCFYDYDEVVDNELELYSIHWKDRNRLCKNSSDEDEDDW